MPASGAPRVQEKLASKAIAALREQSVGHGPRHEISENAKTLGQALGGRRMQMADFRWAMRQLARPGLAEAQPGMRLEVPADPAMLLDATFHLARAMGGRELSNAQVTGMAAALDRVGIEPFLLARCKQTLLTAAGRNEMPQAPPKPLAPALSPLPPLPEVTELIAPPPPAETLPAVPAPPDGPPPA